MSATASWGVFEKLTRVCFGGTHEPITNDLYGGHFNLREFTSPRFFIVAVVKSGRAVGLVIASFRADTMDRLS
jgi:hypothetical protein